MELKDIVLQERQAQNLTQKELADKAGVRQSLITRCETGQSDPKFSTGVKILNALNYDLSKFNTPAEKRDTIDIMSEELTKILHGNMTVQKVCESYIIDFSENVLLFTAVKDFQLGRVNFSKGDSFFINRNTATDIMFHMSNAIEGAISKTITESLETCLLTRYAEKENIPFENFGNLNTPFNLSSIVSALHRGPIKASDIPGTRNASSDESELPPSEPSSDISEAKSSSEK